MTALAKIYSYSSCSTCRKAISWLDGNNITYELIDIVKNPPSKKILRDAFEQIEDRKLIFNTRGISYRSIGAEAIKNMNDNEAIEALSSDGKLIKRPLLITPNGKILLGFDIDIWRNFLK